MNNKKEATKMLTTSQELYDYVMNEYKKTDQELTSSFFDVPVHMKERDILLAYQAVQHDTNGDDIVQLCSGRVLERIQKFSEAKYYSPEERDMMLYLPDIVRIFSKISCGMKKSIICTV